ncbi:MAG: hypothetical protein HRU40_02595 [Saprospiraceae bacterium]|nr:hypothetical protein [Saprospiraceae bacterium]
MRNHTWFLFMIGSLALLFTSSVFLPRDQKEAYRYHYKGSISYSEGNVKQANSFFRKAYHLIPNNFYFAISYGLTTGQIGNKSEGLAVIGKARQSLAYNDPEVKEKNALATFFTGLIYAYNHQFDLAYKNVNNCLPQFPNDSAGISVIQNTLGFLRIRNQANNGHKKAHESPHYHVHRRDLKAALHHFEQALTYDPSNTTAQYNYQTLCDTLKVEPKLITQLSLTLSDDSKPYTPTFINMHVRMFNALELPSFDDVLFLVDISGSMGQESVIFMNDTRFDVM